MMVNFVSESLIVFLLVVFPLFFWTFLFLSGVLSPEILPPLTYEESSSKNQGGLVRLNATP